MRALIPALTLLASTAAADPEADYLANYLGSYSPSATCIGQEMVVTLEADRVLSGETGCSISKILQTGTRITLDLTACTAEGDPAEDRTVDLELIEGTLHYSGRQFTFDLVACTDI